MFHCFRRIFAGLASKMNGSDGTGQIFRPAGPDRLQKICPVPPLVYDNEKSPTYDIILSEAILSKKSHRI